MLRYDGVTDSDLSGPIFVETRCINLFTTTQHRGQTINENINK